MGRDDDEEGSACDAQPARDQDGKPWSCNSVESSSRVRERAAREIAEVHGRRQGVVG